MVARLAVSNRGEIARRVLRAARSLGIETVALFAEDDRHSPFVAEADRAVLLGDGPAAGTYLDVERVVAAALRGGADALHPGYGFLSEDPRLAVAAAAAGLTWVGPPPGAMATMGHKARAKATVADAGVPVLESREVGTGDLAALGREVGYPLLVKASAGGGGRGMRLVEGPSGLGDAVAAAQREATASFGSGEVFLERFVVSPRHVEVQVVADRHGHVVHLFDRECSVQRRHQKVLEEAPASLVPLAARQSMWAAAVEAARAVDYEGVGTVEFVVDGGGGAYFLEMNTRLQVEHAVTEMVTGIDLVELQLAVAAGLPLPFGQDGIAVGGHAIEVRLCAERPREGYRPTPGTCEHVRWPGGEGIRVDAAVETGSVVGATYDSLVAKVMAVAGSRNTAVARLRSAITGPLELDGIETNRDLLAAVLAEPDFVAGRTSTDYLDRHPGVVEAGLPAPVRRRHAAAASLFLEHARAAASLVPAAPPGWRNVGRPLHRDRYAEGLSVAVSRPTGRRRLEVLVEEGGRGEPEPLGGEICARVSPGGTVDLQIDGVLVRHRVRRHHPRGDLVAVSSADGQSTFHLADDDRSEAGAEVAGECRAPLPGSVVTVLVAEGDAVEEGAGLVVVDAMKMEHTLRAPGPGVVSGIRARAGTQVDVGDLLLVVEPPS